MPDNLPQVLLVLFLAFCVLPTVLIIVVAYFAVRRLANATAPDITDMKQRLEVLRTKKPNTGVDVLIHDIIHREAIKCGLIGAVTSFGGLPFLPIGLPLDILGSLRIQSALIQFIAETYGHGNASDAEMRIRTGLVMTGGLRATETTVNMATRFIVRVLGKSLAKIVPFLGAIVGFAVNYTIARGMGYLAVRWYSSRSPLLVQSGKTAPKLPS